MYITPRRARRASGCSTRATGWPSRTSTTACAPGRPGSASLYAPARGAHAPRVQDARDGRRASASCAPSAASGSAGATGSTTAPCAAEDGAPADRLRHPGHRRRRRPPRRLPAPQRARRRAATTSSCGRSRPGRRTGSTCDVPGAQLRDLPGARGGARRRSTRSRSRRGGTPRAGVARRRCAAACPSTSSRTSRRPTTPTTASVHAAVLADLPARVPLRHDVAVGRRRLRKLGADAGQRPAGARPRPLPCRSTASAARATSCSPLGRSEPLKNFPLTRRARTGALPRAAAGAVAVRHRARARPRASAPATIDAPSDEEVNELFNTATVFVQTSRHEGFCLPVARGDGDRRCRRLHRRARQPRLLPRRRELPDARGRARGGGRRDRRACSTTRTCARGSSAAGRETAAANDWARRLDELERFFEGVAASRTPVAG